MNKGNALHNGYVQVKKVSSIFPARLIDGNTMGKIKAMNCDNCAIGSLRSVIHEQTVGSFSRQQC